jgi:hypothetical protein
MVFIKIRFNWPIHQTRPGQILNREALRKPKRLSANLEIRARLEKTAMSKAIAVTTSKDRFISAV